MPCSVLLLVAAAVLATSTVALETAPASNAATTAPASHESTPSPATPSPPWTPAPPNAPLPMLTFVWNVSTWPLRNFAEPGLCAGQRFDVLGKVGACMSGEWSLNITVEVEFLYYTISYYDQPFCQGFPAHTAILQKFGDCVANPMQPGQGLVVNMAWNWL